MKNLTLLLLLFILPFTSMSAFEVDGITYEVVGDGSVGVDRGRYSGDVVIPSTVSYEGQEYTVTEILAEAFAQRSELTSVVIPSSVTHIGIYAFWFCTGLTSVTIPGGVIGESAFQDCMGLRKLVLGENVSTIYQLAFENCTGLQEICAPCKTVPHIRIYSSDDREDPFSEETYANATLYVPEGRGSEYSGANYWKQFQHIVETNLSGVESAPVAEAAVEVIDGKLRFNRDEAEVGIYDMSGKTIFHGTARNGAAFTPAQSGTYVIAVDGKTQKVVLK